MSTALNTESIARQNAMVLAASVGLCDGMTVFRDAPYGREVGVVSVGEGVVVLTEDAIHYNAVSFEGVSRSPFAVWLGASVERLGPEAFEAVMAKADRIRAKLGRR